MFHHLLDRVLDLGLEWPTRESHGAPKLTASQVIDAVTLRSKNLLGAYHGRGRAGVAEDEIRGAFPLVNPVLGIRGLQNPIHLRRESAAVTHRDTRSELKW